MPNGVRFALFTSLDRTARPTVFKGLDGLCRHIHRKRGGDALQLADHDVRLYGDGADGRRMVAVYTQSDTGQPLSFIGWAWLAGASWRVLQTALYEAAPNTAPRAKAA